MGRLGDVLLESGAHRVVVSALLTMGVHLAVVGVPAWAALMGTVSALLSLAWEAWGASVAPAPALI